MARPRMYRRGDPFLTVAEFDAWADMGKWVFWWNRVKHPSIVTNQNHGVLRRLISSHCICRAIKNKED